jgi:hypothetical protein
MAEINHIIGRERKRFDVAVVVPLSDNASGEFVRGGETWKR